MRPSILDHNRDAWDRQVEKKNRWTIPVSAAEIEAARRGEWSVLLTPTKPVPREWFPPLRGLSVLCLASAGGQQGPVLAAAGATVCVFDCSPRQLAQDRMVAAREGLAIETVQGDMADLGVFRDGAFDLVFHPVSNCFVPDVWPVWLESFRVLRPGGSLLAGFTNPVLYLFDDPGPEGCEELVASHRIPYSDLESLPKKEKERYAREGLPFEFGHTLEDQIGGQIRAGFLLDRFYEDSLGEAEHPLATFLPLFIATRAVKPGASG